MSEAIKFHHMMICVDDMDEAIHLWTDIMGLTLASRVTMPDPDTLPETAHMEADFFQSEVAVLDNDGYVLLELIRQIHPQQVKVDAMQHGYGFTGETELGFRVDDINAWYRKIVDAGYTPQSEPWQAAPISGSMTFVFYDKEGNVIQLWEERGEHAHDEWVRWERIPGVSIG